ncbi:MAG: ABC transporter ATP-binding protein [Desulfovibrio sp.]|nr:ABC transporter ATP-binding protein [Desulfovibrio sp.]
MERLFSFEGVTRTFHGPHEELTLFSDLSFAVMEGETLAIVGASGSGKSTLLHLMGALDSPTSGVISYRGRDMQNFDETERAHFRNKELGFVFQFHHLLPEFSAEENVALPAVIGGEDFKAVLPRARLLLERVGLSERMDSRITTLSGGERQRVAIARALLQKPRVILADEPTGNLDADTGTQIEDLLLDVHNDLGTTLVLVTHNELLARRLDRCLALRKGRLLPLGEG